MTKFDDSAAFEARTRTLFSALLNVPLQRGQISGVPKTFDFVSPDHSIAGDAKFYTLVNGEDSPPAKFATIAEYVWLLEKAALKHRFMVFGNDRRVPEQWLQRFGHLASTVAFFFVDAAGLVTCLKNASGDGAVAFSKPFARETGADVGAGSPRRQQSPEEKRGSAAGKRATFGDIWRRVVALEGEEFQTSTGLPFTYEITSTGLITNRTKYNLAQAQFSVAFEHVPCSGPSDIHFVRGPSYIWAILHDRRVRLHDY